MDPIQDTLVKAASDLQTLSEWPRLVHYMTLAIGLLVTSQVLYASTLSLLDTFALLDVLALIMFVLGYAALQLIDPVQQARVHSIIWLLVTPFILYKLQTQLNSLSAGTPKQNLWLLLGLGGAAFQILFMASDYPGLRQAFLGLMIALQALEAIQVGKSDLQTSDKVLVLLLLAFWFVQFVGPNPTREILWSFADMSLPFFIQTISYLLN